MNRYPGKTYQGLFAGKSFKNNAEKKRKLIENWQKKNFEKKSQKKAEKKADTKKAGK